MVQLYHKLTALRIKNCTIVFSFNLSFNLLDAQRFLAAFIKQNFFARGRDFLNRNNLFSTPKERSSRCSYSRFIDTTEHKFALIIFYFSQPVILKIFQQFRLALSRLLLTLYKNIFIRRELYLYIRACIFMYT